MICRATSCTNLAIRSGLCEEHYRDWRGTNDAWKGKERLKVELEKKYDIPHEPYFRNLEDFK